MMDEESAPRVSEIERETVRERERPRVRSLKELCGHQLASYVDKLHVEIEVNRWLQPSLGALLTCELENLELKAEIASLREELGEYTSEVWYPVKSILDSRFTGAKTQYLVEWEDGSESWQPRANVHCPEFIKELRKRKQRERAKERRDEQRARREARRLASQRQRLNK